MSKREFALHIVQESESGTAYEDTIHHQSQSERKVVGIVLALADYLVHDVYEEVPFMLLDLAEAIDSSRIAKLFDHFEEYPYYLVDALLPEDAATFEEEYPRSKEV